MLQKWLTGMLGVLCVSLSSGLAQDRQQLVGHTDLVYTVDQQVAKSRDGGQTWETLSGYGHVDQHAVWINPNNHDHLIIGRSREISFRAQGLL